MRHPVKKSAKERVKELYFGGDDVTHKEIAEELGITEKFVLNTICSCGIRQRDVIQRQKDKWMRLYGETFTITESGEIDRCVQCRIRMVDKIEIVPRGWSWNLNGRAGDICRACVKDMNAQHKRRMNALSRIGCVVCRMESGVHTPPEIHHLRDMLGVGQKRNHDRTIPLCANHHRLGGYGIARHEGLDEWEKRHGRETELLDMVNTVLEDMLQ
jgi:hypothetical protein